MRGARIASARGAGHLSLEALSAGVSGRFGATVDPGIGFAMAAGSGTSGWRDPASRATDSI
jgi:hypothetical protein